MAISPGVTSIYALVDPRTEAVRYVGRSDNLELRYKRHCLYPSPSRKGQWVKELRVEGLRPQLRVLEEVAREVAEAREVHWITVFLQEGANLTNGFRSSVGKFTVKSSTDPLIRFWAKVDKRGPRKSHMPTRCWMWTGKKGQRGHGQFKYQDEAGNWRDAQATRWLWKKERGPLADTLVLDHLCENPPCVRLDHLNPTSLTANTMRGKSPHAANARKTHCPEGHEYNAENTYLVYGERHCRICNLAATKMSQAKRRADPVKREVLNAQRRAQRQGYRRLNPLPPKPLATTCRRGHPWIPENIDWFQEARHCKQCRRDRHATYQTAPQGAVPSKGDLLCQPICR